METSATYALPTALEAKYRFFSMGILTIYEPNDLKKVYRALQSHLLEHPELLDSEFLQDLQHHLQYRARREGVDLCDHGAWDAWLAERQNQRPQLRLVTE